MNYKNESIVSFIRQQVFDAITKYITKYELPSVSISEENINVDKTRNSKFGDFTTNVVMSLQLGNVNKIDAAKEIAQFIDPNSFAKIEVAGPGFLNFYLNDLSKKLLLDAVYSTKDFGQLKKKKLWYNIEFVSANPTGLLHIGHARNGAYGDSLARILEANGVKVDREYYINDGGNQINKLALSVLIRYLQSFGNKVELPEDSYHAQEIVETAALLKQKYKDKFIDVKFDANQILDEKANKKIGDFSKKHLLEIIKEHLAMLNVEMDLWSPESYIYKHDLINAAFKKLSNYMYDAEGAKWLKTTQYGDDKDRVLIKSDGHYTYFTPDIAYHNIKLSRGYDKIFNIWGADHKSYVDRMSIAIQMLGFKKEQMHVCIMQMVQLTKNGQEFKMSKRTGNSFTTIDLINLIGKDAARWYLVNQSLDSHITIDVEKAGKKNNENGLFYVQYAYVRIKQILNKVNGKPEKDISLLTHPLEQELINHMFFFMPTIENIGKTYEVHKMCLYLTNLAKLVHTYYEQVRISDCKDEKLIGQRLYLIECVAKIIKNGLELLGIDVAEKM